ncbi:MAG: cysteine--tRNA ligase [Oscillospiraceae bacterium]|jgi:cysteinyl-tRNA synthetase|nr:cysteine--tRNA ligase [Oscillospiraceae bacterium]
MLIYNTLTRRKEEFVTVNPGRVGVYACGPTVYNLTHLGNARQICVFDVIRRYLKYRGYGVFYVQNFTDVDDRIIKRANELGISPFEHSENMITEYYKDARGLNVLDADAHPKVTENIDIIIDIIGVLIKKGFAYQSRGDVYFSTDKLTSGYGKLSGNSLEELREGASNRLDAESEKKRAPLDFALWKAAKEGEPYWESPFGNGRPGWHIECSAMSRHYIGNTIDIHGGGADLIFPHHENEIAQSEAATGQPLAKYWVHNGMLNIDNVKMSKSKNNFFLTRAAAEKYGYEPVRFMLLSAHYRSQMNYSAETLESAAKSVERLRNCARLMDAALRDKANPDGAPPSDYAEKIVSKRRSQFINAMDDDFNAADGIAALFEFVRDINAALSGGAPARDVEEYRGLFGEINGVLGLVYADEEEIPGEIIALAEKRQAAKQAKDYVSADKIRGEINEKGYIMEESRQGFTLRKRI